MWLHLIFEYLLNYCRIEVIHKYLYFSKQYRMQKLLSKYTQSVCQVFF